MNRPRILTLEEALHLSMMMNWWEVTPESIRLRKEKILNKSAREKKQKELKHSARRTII